MISSSRRSSTPNATIALQVIGRAAIVADSGSLVGLVGLVALRQRSVGRRVDTGWQHGTNVQRILFIVAAGSPFAPTSLFSPASLVFVHHLSSNSCTMRHARRGGGSPGCVGCRVTAFAEFRCNYGRYLICTTFLRYLFNRKRSETPAATTCQTCLRSALLEVAKVRRLVELRQGAGRGGGWS